MKKTFALVLALGLTALFSLSFASTTEDEVMKLKGDIIDNMCAKGNKDNLDEFVQSHTKACALMPNCVASGYSLYADGKLHMFDAESNKKVEEYLRMDDSKLKVMVSIKKAGEKLSLVSIEGQK